MTSTKKFKLTQAQKNAVKKVVEVQLNSDKTITSEFSTGNISVSGYSIPTATWAGLWKKGVIEAARGEIFPPNHEHHKGSYKSPTSQFNDQFYFAPVRFTQSFIVDTADNLRNELIAERKAAFNIDQQKNAFIDDFKLGFTRSLRDANIDAALITDIRVRLYSDDPNEWEAASLSYVTIDLESARVWSPSHYRRDVPDTFVIAPTVLRTLETVEDTHDFVNDLLTAQLIANYMTERCAEAFAAEAAAADDLEAEEIAAADLRNGE
jgi:hypothetical protein